MDALKEIGPEDKVAIKSLEAGCDIILDPVDGESLVQKLAVHIDDSHDFSLRAKKSVERLFGLKKNIQPPSDSFPDRTLSKELVAEIARKSVCLLKGKTSRTI